MNTYKFKIAYKEDLSREDRLNHHNNHLDELARGLALSVGDLENAGQASYSSEGNVIIAKTGMSRHDVLNAIKGDIRAVDLDVKVIDED